MADGPLDWLFSLAQFGIKLGLQNIRDVLAELGHPEEHFVAVHIAGTNGKGSVTAMVERALRAAGHRTGRYTSPHLLELRERFAVDGEPVSEAEMLDAVATVRTAVEHLRARGTMDVHPTFFEVTTAAAFELFRRRGVDIAVCEVGLGGRLDATNVLLPVACAITSIGFDHQQYLGSTLAEIAGEKAGILKAGVPAVIGAMDAGALRVIAARAAAVGAPVTLASDGCVHGPLALAGDGAASFTLRTPAHDYGTLHVGLAGDHQAGNALVAVRLLEAVEQAGVRVGREAIATGIRDVRWPGRLETRRFPDGRSALLDAAHNADGAAALARHLARQATRPPLVFAAMRDKDASTMLSRIAPHVSRLIVTRASNPRSSEPADLAALAGRLAPALPVEQAESPAAALALAWAHAPAIAVAGSIFLLADVMKEVGRS